MTVSPTARLTTHSRHGPMAACVSGTLACAMARSSRWSRLRFGAEAGRNIVGEGVGV